MGLLHLLPSFIQPGQQYLSNLDPQTWRPLISILVVGGRSAALEKTLYIDKQNVKYQTRLIKQILRCRSSILRLLATVTANDMKFYSPDSRFIGVYILEGFFDKKNNNNNNNNNLHTYMCMYISMNA